MLGDCWIIACGEIMKKAKFELFAVSTTKVRRSLPFVEFKVDIEGGTYLYIDFEITRFFRTGLDIQYIETKKFNTVHIDENVVDFNKVIEDYPFLEKWLKRSMGV